MCYVGILSDFFFSKVSVCFAMFTAYSLCGSAGNHVLSNAMRLAPKQSCFHRRYTVRTEDSQHCQLLSFVVLHKLRVDPPCPPVQKLYMFKIARYFQILNPNTILCFSCCPFCRVTASSISILLQRPIVSYVPPLIGPL